uniref:BSD domain-containing protein n=1 Tax=Romanomermis culicivorax TaxID=13658 RepID=A0A915K8Q3_ROMCU
MLITLTNQNLLQKLSPNVQTPTVPKMTVSLGSAAARVPASATLLKNICCFLDDINEDDAENQVQIRHFLDRSNPMEAYSNEKFWSRFKLSEHVKRAKLLRE